MTNLLCIKASQFFANCMDPNLYSDPNKMDPYIGEFRGAGGHGFPQYLKSEGVTMGLL